jgi:rod shape-determining protein MreC
LFQLRRHNDSRLFSRAPSAALKTLAFVVASVTLMVYDQRAGHLVQLHRALSTVVYPVRALVDLPFDAADWLSEALATRKHLLTENRALRQQALEQAARLQRLDALETENARLRALMESARRLKDRVVVAELLAVDLDPYRHQVVVDKGTGDGVYTGQPLIDAYGVVGQVTHVGPNSADAILITDASHAIPVEVNRNGLRTIAVGTGDIDRLDLPYLPNNADIQQGDLLVTSGLGGRFPRGYPVAIVDTVKHAPGQGFVQVGARPTARLNRSREVLLVWSGNRHPENTVRTGAREGQGR